jgi:P4 family phage/plasmid primase-like protien
MNSKELTRVMANMGGNNRALNNLAEHVMEFLVKESEERDATCYPYFAVGNGTLNLISKQLMPPSLRPLTAMRSNVIYDPTAEAPLFLKTLSDIFQEDEEMIAYVLRVFGYILLGKPNKHVFLVFFGPTGRNGKSLLVEVLRAVLGEFACSLPTTMIMTKSHVNDGATPTLARLVHKRLVIVSEPNRKHQLDAGFIKQLTGGEHVVARALYGADVEYLPEFVPLMVTNVMPEIREDDDALWRRMQIVTFSRTFSDDEIDPDLKEKLLRETSGILNVLLTGVRDYLTTNLSPPKKISNATVVQRKLVDPIEEWIQECVAEDAGARTPLKFLWASYETWHKSNLQVRLLRKKEFGQKLVLRGYNRFEKSHLPYHIGICLKEPLLT